MSHLFREQKDFFRIASEGREGGQQDEEQRHRDEQQHGLAGGVAGTLAARRAWGWGCHQKWPFRLVLRIARNNAMSITTVPSPSVAVSVTADDAEPREPKQSTYVIAAVIITSLLFFFGLGGALLLFTGEVPLAVGVALFTAFWGGPGFGLMAGMALYDLRVHRG